jgi:lipopolysaccharide export system protein LptA
MTKPNSRPPRLVAAAPPAKPPPWRRCWRRLLSGVLLFGVATVVQALATDRDQKINIDADFCGYEEQEGTAVCTGNVIVTQGSIRMTGDRLRMYRSDDKQLERAVLEGKPATFQQRSEDGRNDLSGRAATIERYEQKNLLILLEEAQATRGEETIAAPRIEYDTELHRLTAQGSTGDATKPAGRVRVVWPPNRKEQQ